MDYAKITANQHVKSEDAIVCPGNIRIIYKKDGMAQECPDIPVAGDRNGQRYSSLIIKDYNLFYSKKNPPMKTSLICFCLFFLLISASTTMAQSNTAQPAALNHIALYVSNLKTSTDFYKDIFHLAQIEEPFKDGRHTWFSLGGSVQLHLVVSAGVKAPQNKTDHLCFSVKSIDDIIKTLDSRGINFTNLPGTAKEPTLRVDGVKQIYLQDPDGQWIEVNDAVTVSSAY